jgi:hypothetical protein
MVLGMGFLIFCISCKHKGDEITVEKLLSTTSIKEGKNILFLVLQPDDCPNCYGNLERHFRYLIKEENFPQSNLFIIMPHIRRKVKDTFLKNVLPFDTTRHAIIESSRLADDLKTNLDPNEEKSSCLLVFSPEKHLKHVQLFKKISSHEELLKLIQ